jgi:quercetin dioxygenase-like cupin family protein
VPAEVAHEFANDGVVVIRDGELPLSGSSREFIGDDHGGVGISVIMVDAEPGRGPALHKHDYDELFIVVEGQATFFTGDEEIELHRGTWRLSARANRTGSRTRAMRASARSTSI